VKASIVGAVLACSLSFAPVAHADTNHIPINDPYTDTLQLWSEIATAARLVAHDLATLFQPQQVARPSFDEFWGGFFKPGTSAAASEKPQSRTPQHIP
jgi:hypothetical protein